MDKKAFKRMFPNLAKELTSDSECIQVDSVRTDIDIGEKSAIRRGFADYMPSVIDFLRRCETNEQAEEIIVYLEKRREIDRQYAERLRRQLKKNGVRSFGPKKECDYYLKHGGT